MRVEMSDGGRTGSSRYVEGDIRCGASERLSDFWLRKITDSNIYILIRSLNVRLSSNRQFLYSGVVGNLHKKSTARTVKQVPHFTFKTAT
jgi:hypothetical protein